MANVHEEELEACRREIDDVDGQIVDLLNRRARLAQRIGEVKRQEKDATFVPGREQQVLNNVLLANGGPLSRDHVRAIYTEILSASRALQRPLRIAYLGPEATFTHRAATTSFGRFADYTPTRRLEDVFQYAEQGHVDYGVVPIENSTEGAVSHTLDLFVDSPLKICSEILLVITHHLLANCRVEQVQRVHSHPQGLAQCRRWLAEHLPHAELIEESSTAHAAQRAASESQAAAIGTEEAAELYGLDVLADNIQDQAHNFTRFLVVGQEMSQPSGYDKTSIIFAVRDRVGALHAALGVFAGRGINLTRIESRPSKRRAWEYIFFADFVGHPLDDRVAGALTDLERECTLVKVLGAWPLEQRNDFRAQATD